MKRIQITFNEKQLTQLESEKDRLGSSIASIVRSAVVDYFSKQEAEQ
jgi:hypothetical protein